MPDTTSIQRAQWQIRAIQRTLTVLPLIDAHTDRQAYLTTQPQPVLIVVQIVLQARHAPADVQQDVAMALRIKEERACLI